LTATLRGQLRSGFRLERIAVVEAPGYKHLFSDGVGRRLETARTSGG
jgi:hypothetical protein